MAVFRLGDAPVFPPVDWAEPDGLLAAGGDLSAPRLLRAYAQGIFPWYEEGCPILWWAPDPRLVLYPREFHLGKTMRRLLRQGVFHVTADTDFPAVIAACAGIRGPHREGTWITPEMMDAYIALHREGYAHSIECWQDGVLAGGLYGVSLGAAFFGESMFSNADNASKTAMACLAALMLDWGFHFIDCQLPTNHLRRFGAREVPRAVYLRKLAAALGHPTRLAPWRIPPGLDPVDAFGRRA